MKILVTGGASGLGAAIVTLLAAQDGNFVYFTYAGSLAAAKEMEATHPNTKAIFCNFSQPASVSGLLAQLAAMDIDVLVNNANTKMHKSHFYKTGADVFLKSFEQNIIPALQITQEAIKLFRKKKFGKIINILSSAIINKPPAGWSEYVANKAYLLAMSKAWATEGIKFNITSNSISPAFMETNFTSDTDERIVEQMKEEHPLKKLLTTGEVAASVLYFVNASQQINGTNLIINAGADLA